MKKNDVETEHPKTHGSHVQDEHYKAMLEFVKWIYEWSRFADFSIRQKATALLREIGELE